MKTLSKGPSIHEKHITLNEFVISYNKMIPTEWPQATVVLMKKFKESNLTLFKNGELWSIDLHRKRIIDWLPLNSRVS